MPRIVCDPNPAGSPPEQWHEGDVYLPGSVRADNCWDTWQCRSRRAEKPGYILTVNNRRGSKITLCPAPDFTQRLLPSPWKTTCTPHQHSVRQSKKSLWVTYWQGICYTVSSQNNMYFKNYSTFLETKTGLKKIQHKHKKSHVLKLVMKTIRND